MNKEKVFQKFTPKKWATTREHLLEGVIAARVTG
jgi:hypothetical protein